MHDDVRNLDFSSLSGSIDLVSGGPPCQPFSLGGRHKAHNDARDMFPQAIRAIREIRPPAFIFENVKGLQRSSFRNYLEYIRLQMTYPEIVKSEDEVWSDHLAKLEQHHSSNSTSGLSYRVVSQVLDAADYGVPQRRERMFFVGFREDLHVRWSFPIPTHSREALIWDQKVGSYWDRHSTSKQAPQVDGDVQSSPLLPWRTVRDAIAGLPEPTAQAHSLSGHDYRAGARAYRGHTGSTLDLPAKTLKAGVHGVPGGENMFVQDDGALRYFTIRECARLQTFPDEFEFHGSWSEAIRQVGNAVPVEIASILGKHIADSIAPFVGAQRATYANP